MADNKDGMNVENNNAPLESAAMQDNQQLMATFLSAAKQGDVNTLRQLLNNVSLEGSSSSLLSASDKDGSTALHLAADNGQLPVIQYLVDRKIDIYLRDGQGMNAMERAAKLGNLEVVKYFVSQRKVSTNLKDDLGMSALSWATSAGHLEVVEFLVREGADINVLDKNNMTPLLHALITNKWDVFKYLVVQGADINVTNTQGRSVLHTLIQMRRWDMVKYLLSMGVHVNVLDNDNKTPIQSVIEANEWDIVKYMIRKGAQLNNLNSDQKNKVLEHIVLNSNDHHKSFANAIHLGNFELLDMLINKFNNEYNSGTQVALKLDDVLAETYEELKIKNVPLLPEIEYYIENKLIGLRCFSENTETNKEVVKSTFVDIRKRIDMVVEQIQKLNEQYSNTEATDIDSEFFLVGKYLTQNIHVLKRQLRSTYSKLPWEEIEFFLSIFLSTYEQHKKFDYLYQMVLDKDMLLTYLHYFSERLNEVKNELSEEDVGSKFPSKLDPNLSARQEAESSIISKYPFFEDFYRDYKLVRDIYSLKRIESYIKLALSTNLDDESSRLVIERTLQVIGESLKNTLESPNISDEIHQMLLYAAPKNVREIITLLRDSLSHTHTLKKRMDHEDSSDNRFFENIKNDLRKIEFEITDILYRKNFQAITTFLNKIINSKSLEEVKKLCNSFSGFELERAQLGRRSTKELEIATELIEELDNELKDEAGLQSEKELVKLIKDIVLSQKARLTGTAQDFSYGVDAVHITIGEINNYMLYDVESIKKVAQTFTENVKPKIETIARQEILNTLEKISFGIERRMDANKSDKIKLLIYNIKCTIEFEANRIKGIHTFKTALDGRQGFVNNAALEKIKTVLNEIETNIVAKPDIKVFKETLKYRIKKYKAQQNIISLFENLSEGLVNKEDTQVIKRYSDLVQVLEMKSSKEEALHESFGNGDWTACKKIINNLGNKYATLVNSVKNSLHDGIETDLATTFKRFFSVKQLNKVIDKILKTNQQQFQTYYEKRLAKLKQLLSTDSHSLRDDVTTLVMKYETIKEFQAAIDMLLLDLTDLLENNSLFADNRFSLDNHSPLLIGKTLRNYLAHGDILYNILPHRLSNTIISHAFVLIKENTDLLTQKNKLIGKRVEEAFDISHQKYERELKMVRTKMRMLTGTKQGNIETVKSCVETAMDVYSRDSKEWTGLHYAAQSNDIEVLEYFLQHNLEVATTDWYGDNMLHLSASSKSDNIIKYIIEENKINVNTLDAEKKTILHYVAENNDDKGIVDFLINKGAEVDVLDESEWTPLHFAAIKGHGETVTSLLTWGANVNAKNHVGVTPLHYATFRGHHRLAQALLEKGALADARDKDDWTSLHMAALSGHSDVIETLLNNGASVDARDFKDRTPLFIATFGGKLNVVVKLISKGANINSVSIDEMSPLHLAVQFGQTDVIRVLLQRGARVNALNNIKESPLHLAAIAGHLDAVLMLLEHKSGGDSVDSNHSHSQQEGSLPRQQLEIDIVNKDECTPMFLAAKQGHIEIVTLLLQHGANIEAHNNQGMTPLHISTLEGNKEVVERLLEAGANVHTENIDGTTLLHSAAYIGEQNIASLLLENGINVDARDKDEYTPLHMAAKRGRVAALRTLLDNGADINAQNRELITPLHMAAKYGHMDISEELLSRHAKANALLTDFSTPLHVSAYYGHHNIARALLTEGAEVDASNNDNMRPLHLAGQNGYPEVAVVLLKKKADVNALGKDSRTALHLAAQNGHQDVVTVLLDNGADVNVEDSLKSRPLHLATEKGREEVVNTLLTYKANVNAVNINKITPLHVAAFKGHGNIAKMLLDYGANVNALDKDYRTPLHFSVFTNHKDIAKILLDSAGAVDPRDTNNMTPLHMAAQFGSNDMAKLLLEHSANVNAVDGDNDTALHLAAEKGKLEVVQTLLESGAKVNEFNNEGMTPLHKSSSEGHVHIVEMLLNRGAEVNALSKDNITPLHLAAERGDQDICHTLLDNGADVLSRNSYDTVLHRAVEGDNEEVLTMILQTMKDKLMTEDSMYNSINAHDTAYDTPLMLATKEGKVNAVKSLLEFGAYVDAENNKGRTALHYAVENNNLQLVQILIENNANVGKQDMNGSSPLDLATEIHNHGPEQEERTLIVALLQSVTNPQADLVLRTLQYEGKIKPYSLEPIHLAALNGKLDAVLHFLETGTDVNTRDEKNMTPLHFAAKNGHLDIVNTLINSKASVDARNIDNWTPLTFATSNGHKDVVEVLLANKADVNAQDDTKLSPLHIASVVGHTDVVETLLSNGAQVDIVNIDNVTPLHLACEVGYKDIVDILFKHGANIEYPGKKEMRAIHYAAKKGHDRVVEDLLEKGSNIEARAQDGCTALHYAAAQGRGETVALLLQRGANIHARARDDVRPLHFAAASGRLQVAVNLLEHGADVDALAGCNKTPLYYAAVNGKNDVLQALIHRGANVNIQTTEGMTPLHYATLNGFADVVFTLLQSGAATNVCNSHQDTAEDLARKNGYFEIIKLFHNVNDNRASTEEVKALTENLAALQTEQENVGLKAVGGSCSSQGRDKRDIRHCVDDETEQEFPYEPLEETTRVDGKMYLHVAMAVVLEHLSQFQHSYGTRAPIEAISMYAQNIGDITNEKSFNQSPREKRILNNHHKNAMQFFKSFPKDKILLLSMKSSYATSNIPSVPQSWLFQSGPYSLLMFYDGKGFEVYSSDLNYRHRFKTRENVTFEAMEGFIEAFFKWRGNKHTYKTFTLNKPLLDTIIEHLKDSPFWSPEKVAPDSVVMAEEHFGLIESLPAEEIQAMFYVNGHSPDMAALHPAFFQQYKGKITFRVQVLHKRIASLNINQVQALLKIIQKYNLSTDGTYLQNVSPDARLLLESYGKKVTHELGMASTTSLERLSELSWETLADHLGAHPQISEELKEGILATTKELHTSATRAAWAKGMATQTLFFLPDMIRAVNTGDVTNLAHIGAMLGGDATVNTIYVSLVNNLQTVLSESRIKLLRTLPVTSPIFKVLTIYSIVELTKQLQTLPPKSEMRGIIEHKLGEQYLTAGLMVAELLGFEVTPLWLGLIAEQLLFDADAFRKQNHLNIPFWEALLMSLGFEQSRLHTILEERQLVEMNLVAVNQLNKRATVPYGWVLVKHPRLGDFKWVTVHADQVPTKVRQRIDSKRTGRAATTAEEVLASDGYRLVNKYKFKTFSAYSTAIGTRGNLIHSYWQKGVYKADPIHAQVDISKHRNDVHSFKEEDNIFLDQVQVDSVSYRRVPSIAGGRFLDGIDPVKRSITGAAVYVNKQTYLTPNAQSNFYLGFDPREGNLEVNFTGEGLEKIDHMNVVHNLGAGSSTMYNSYNATSAYLLTIHVRSKLYPSAIEFSQQGGALIVSDNSCRVVSQYLLSGDTNYTIKDSTLVTRIIFNAGTSHQEDIKSNLSCPTINSNDNDVIEVKNWQCTKNSTNKIQKVKVTSTGYIELSRNKKYLQMHLNDHTIDKEIRLFAKNVEIVGARGVNADSSAIILGDEVKSFSIATRGDVMLKNGAVQLHIEGTVSSDQPALVISKTVHNKAFTLYNIINNDLNQIINSMTHLNKKMFPVKMNCQFSTSELVYNFYNSMPSTNLLRFEGELDGRKGIFTVEQTYDTLSMLGDDSKIHHIEVKHYSEAGILDPGLVLKDIIHWEKRKPTSKDDNYHSKTVKNGGMTVLHLTRPDSTSTGSVLEFQSLDGHLVYHQFPSHNITVNGIRYLIKKRSVCVINAEGDEIDGREILPVQSTFQTKQNKSTVTVDVCFMQSLQDSKVSVKNGSLIINGLFLHHFSDSTRIYFDKQAFSIRALKDSLVARQAHILGRGQRIRKRNTFDNYDTAAQEQDNTVNMNYLLSINPPEEHNNPVFQEQVEDSEENQGKGTTKPSQATEDVTPTHDSVETTPFPRSSSSTSPPLVTSGASSVGTPSINNIFKWIRSVSNYFTTRGTRLATDSQQNTLLRVDSRQTVAKTENIQYPNSFKNSVDTSLFDFNGTLALADLVIRYFTKEKPYAPHNQSMSFLEAQLCALNITAAYEKTLKELTQIQNILVEDLEFNPVDTQTRVMAKVLSSDYSKLPEILYTSINNSKIHTTSTKYLNEKISEILEQNMSNLMMTQDTMDKPQRLTHNGKTEEQVVHKHILCDARRMEYCGKSIANENYHIT